MTEWYILEERTVMPVASYDEFTAWRKRQDPGPPTFTKRIAADDVNDVHVSTVFLGLDHGYGDGPPVVFETMTFDHRTPARIDEWCWRYSTLDEAEAGHRRIVAAIERGEDPEDE